MGTNYIAPIWRMPENANKDELSNYSIYFDGVDYINVGVAPELDLTSALSISAWVTFDDFVGTGGIFENQISSGGNIGYKIFRWNNELKFQIQGTAIAYNTQTGGTIPQMVANTWYHIICTWDGSTSKMYINNTEVASGSVSSVTYAGNLAMIGKNQPYSGTWEGRISNISVFDYALSSSQKLYLYNLNNPMTITGAEPVAYWPLGDNSNPNANAGYPNISVGADSVFDFNSDYIEVDPIVKEFDSDNFSISAWVNFDTLPSGTTEMKIYNELGSSNRYISLTTRGSQPTILFRYGNQNNNYLYGTTTITTNRWYHVAVTYSTTDGIKLYLDNNEENTASYLALARSAHGYASIGAYFYAGSASNYLDGKISNMQLWDVSLESTDIETLYNNGQPLMTGTQPQAANLKAWYKLNQSANWEADSALNWQIPDALSPSETAIEFSDTNQKITVNPNMFKAVANSSFQKCTISWWMHSSATSYSTLFVLAGNNYRQLRFDPNGKLYFLAAGGGTYRYWPSAISLYDGKWHHCTFVIPDPLNIENSEFWIDGEKQVDAGNASGAYAGQNYAMDQLAIGVPSSIANTLISNLCVWGNDLTNSEIESLYNSGIPKQTNLPQTSSLKGFWPMDKANSQFVNYPDSNSFVPNNWFFKPFGVTPGATEAINFAGAYQNQNGGYEGFNFPNEDFALTDNKFLLSFWYKQSKNTPGYIYFDAGGGAANTMYITGSLFRVYGGASSGSNFSSLNFGLPTNGFAHIVIYMDQGSGSTFDATDSSKFKMFLNGVETKTDNITQDWQVRTKIKAFGHSVSTGQMQGVMMSNLSLFTGNNADVANVSTLYNGGTPGDISSLSPSIWYKLDSNTVSFNTSGAAEYQLTDSSGNGNIGIGAYSYNKPANQKTSIQTIDVLANQPVANGTVVLPESAMKNNNVSTLNGESSGMDTTNLVQSNLTRKQPFSNYSINFDSASADYMQVPDPGSSVLAYGENKFSFSGWINPTTFVNQGGLIARYKNSTSRTTLKGSYQNGFDGLMFQSVDDPSTPNFHITWDNILTANEWQHVCLIYDGANTSCTMYINGVDQGAGVITGVIPTSLPDFSGYPIDIAVDAMNGLNNRNYDGQFSNFAIFDSILTQGEVLNLYNNGVPQDLSNFRIAPTAWYPMDQSYTYFNGSVLVARDVISANDGTGVNVIQEDIIGNAPGSDANGTGTNLTIADLKGDMKSSINNSYSINMADYADGVTNPANSGRSTNVP